MYLRMNGKVTLRAATHYHMVRWRSLKVDVAEILVFRRRTIVAIGVHMLAIYLFMSLTWLVYYTAAGA
jgi:hypothetical protein